MNRAVRGRRLASPVRLALAIELGTLLDGAWWPHTVSIADELPELVDALSGRLGEIVAISINWTSLEGSLNYDALNRARISDHGGGIEHHRLMMVAGRTASARLLVVPCSTSKMLAMMVLRQAADLPLDRAARDTREFRTSEYIVCTARAESSACGRSTPDAPLPHANTADPVVTG